MNKTAERALLARPLASCLGALAVVWLNPNLRQDTFFLWLAISFGGPNLLLWVARDLRPVGRIAPIASPAISLLGWGTLATFTLGLKSPILAAFFFEIGLAAVSMGPPGVVGVTTASIGVLFVVQSLFGLHAGWQLLLLEAGFLAVMGGLGVGVARRRLAGEAALRAQGDALGQRLDVLQRQLEDARVVSRVGENVARLAHGLKNAVHSLRGFIGLIEPEIAAGGTSKQALAGLRAAIDDLERLARLTLSEPGIREGDAVDRDGATAPRSPRPIPADGPSMPVRPPPLEAPESPVRAASLARVLAAATRDLEPAHPEIQFDVRVVPDARELAVPIAETPLQELLTILLRNAVEAMHGVGRCTVELTRRGERAHVEIGDEGDGLPKDAADRLFTPGFTTKAGGSGFGLFLARRIVEDHGGSLGLAAGPEKGAIATLELPLAGARGEGHGAATGSGAGAGRA